MPGITATARRLPSDIEDEPDCSAEWYRTPLPGVPGVTVIRIGSLLFARAGGALVIGICATDNVVLFSGGTR